MSKLIKNGIVFGGALFFVFLLVVASAYGWGAEEPAEELQAVAEDGEIDDDHHHHHRVHHGGYYVPFYSSYGRRGSSRGAGGFRGGK